MQVGVFDESAVLSRRRRAWLEQTDGLGPGLDGWVAVVASGISTDARLHREIDVSCVRELHVDRIRVPSCHCSGERHLRTMSW